MRVRLLSLRLCLPSHRQRQVPPSSGTWHFLRSERRGLSHIKHVARSRTPSGRCHLHGYANANAINFCIILLHNYLWPQWGRLPNYTWTRHGFVLGHCLTIKSIIRKPLLFLYPFSFGMLYKMKLNIWYVCDLLHINVWLWNCGFTKNIIIKATLIICNISLCLQMYMQVKIILHARKKVIIWNELNCTETVKQCFLIIISIQFVFSVIWYYRFHPVKHDEALQKHACDKICMWKYVCHYLAIIEARDCLQSCLC